MTAVLQLADGSYDALIVDASAEGDELAIELTILSGAHKGEIVALRATGLDLDEVDALGLPGTLHVEKGLPRFDVEK